MKRLDPRFLPLVAIGLFFVLGGPTPGAVGSCSSSSDIADAEQFCIDRRTWECERNHVRNDITDMQYEACRGGILMQCSGAMWACRALTTREAESCISALSDPNRLDEANNEIAECQFPSTECLHDDSDGGTQ